MILQFLKSLDRSNSRIPRTRRIRPRHDPAIRLRKTIPRPRRRNILGPSLCRRLLNRLPLPLPNRLQHALLLLALGREARDFLADDDRVVRDRVEDAREDGAAVTHGRDDAAVAVDLRGEPLQLARARVVEERGVAGRGEEDAVLCARVRR